MIPPPPFAVALFPAMVTELRAEKAPPLCQMPPPCPLAVLPLTVALIRLRPPRFSIPPPFVAEVLPLT